MSNRNFDASVVAARLRDKNVAQQIYGAMRNGRAVGNPQTMNANASIMPEYNEGVETVVEQGLRARYTFDLGGIANYVALDQGGGVPVFTVPGAPTINTIGIDDGALTVYFTAPTDGGSPLLEYEYSYTNLFILPPTPVVITVAADLFPNPFIIAGLINGVGYDITLRARNSVGWGPVATAGPAVPATVPGAPTITGITPLNGQLSVAFNAPGSDGGASITNYEYSTDNGVNWTTRDPESTTSPLVITGLVNGTTYQVLLRAKNSQGSGAESTAVSAIPGTPTAPRNLIITPGANQLSVAFDPPVSDNGSLITNYQYSTNNGMSWTSRFPIANTSPLVITGLTNGVTYQVKLRAVNLRGPGEASTTVPGTPATTAPTPPPIITSGVEGDKAIYILYTAGGTGGSPINNYKYSTDNGITYRAFTPSQIGNPLIITSPSDPLDPTFPFLSNGTPYTVLIKASNIMGDSDASNPTSVTPTVNTLNAVNRLIHLDASISASYPGSGTLWTNLDSSSLYNATLKNGPFYTPAGPSAGYFTFDGINQIADISQATAINPTIGSAFTLQIWAQVNIASTNFGPGDGLISKQYGPSSFDGYSLGLDKVSKSLYLKMNGFIVDGTYSSAPDVYNNQWALYTIVVRFGGGSLAPSYAYVSTQQVATGTNTETSIPSNNAPIQFPRGVQDGTSNFCPANVGAFYLYNRALSQEDIIKNYDATKTPYGL